MVAFWYFTKTDSSSSYLITDAKTTDSTDAKYISNMLQQMAKVTLDDSIFSNQIFQNLKDNTISLSLQQAGRNNPFAPIGNNSVVVSKTSQPASSIRLR